MQKYSLVYIEACQILPNSFVFTIVIFWVCFTIVSLVFSLFMDGLVKIVCVFSSIAVLDAYVTNIGHVNMICHMFSCFEH